MNSYYRPFVFSEFMKTWAPSESYKRGEGYSFPIFIDFMFIKVEVIWLLDIHPLSGKKIFNIDSLFLTTKEF